MQCELLAVTRSSMYYEPVAPDAEELAVMRRIDALPDQTFRAEGALINRKRVQLGALGHVSLLPSNWIVPPEPQPPRR